MRRSRRARSLGNDSAHSRSATIRCRKIKHTDRRMKTRAGESEMTALLNIIKPAVRALRAYTLSPHRATVKINQNENPWDAPAEIKDEVLRRFAARQWSR